MVNINGNTPIQMTLTQVLLTVASGVSATLLGVWAILTFTIGSLQSDVSDIRGHIAENQGRNTETHQYAVTADSELRSEIAGLTAELRITNQGLANLAQSVGGLNDSIRAIDVRLTRSIQRQEEFERSVLIRLGPVGTEPTKYAIPMDWGKTQDTVYQEISTGSDPVLNWYRLSTEK